MDGAVRFAGWRAIEDKKTVSNDGELKSDRVYNMYHGTQVDNAEDIIINSFKPSTRGLLGKGVYVTRNFRKAKCYPLRTDKRDQVVFKLKVNVGRVKNIDCCPVRTNWHDEGYDCAWVPPHSEHAVLRSCGEEGCVHDPKRVTVVDVAFCVDKGKRRKLRNLIQSHTRNLVQSHVRSNKCPACLQSFLDLSHETRDCWACGEMVCPFEKEHMCMK
ncbi:hypothetical protein HF521_013499 [Silurus meridionalis]|uniref:PARP catalytic domain-containing protein n=1 Tax=Silurus meridionalis TaxID=175797 RepID=A0A8T0A9K6_SILME|nr:hypothetical protein HF521_013499 [Silurus meridionalis]